MCPLGQPKRFVGAVPCPFNGLLRRDHSVGELQGQLGTIAQRDSGWGFGIGTIVNMLIVNILNIFTAAMRAFPSPSPSPPTLIQQVSDQSTFDSVLHRRHFSASGLPLKSWRSWQ